MNEKIGKDKGAGKLFGWLVFLICLAFAWHLFL
jgi:hypothetical protein